MNFVRKTSKIFAAIAIFAIVLSFASCGLFGGALELESFTVDRSSIKTSYLIGEEIDFSGIRANVKYSDASLNTTYTYEDLTITYPDDITATEGTKEVSVSFDDPHLNVKQETKVQITVSKDGSEVTEPQFVVQFEKPEGITAFENSNKAAGTLAYGTPGFESEFAVGEQTYVIGNENAFKLNPIFAILNEAGLPEETSSFYSSVKISIINGDDEIELTSTEGEGNIVNFFDGEKLIVSVDTFKGEYNFTDAALGSKVVISVTPSEEYYIYDGNAVTLEASIIKAYNVYEAWELAVIHNHNSTYDDFKIEKGIAGFNVSGVVLHNDLKLTADDVPASFFYTSEKDVVYTMTLNGETKTKTVPAGTKYLIDGKYIYERSGVGDFVLEGNFFAIDATEFPLVASPAVFGKDAGKDYGVDFSNAALFRFESTAYRAGLTKPEDVAEVKFNNLQILGNAARDSYLDAEDKLASAGGLIFAKSSNFTELTIDNVVGNSFFITYFVDYGGEMYVNDVKCYDSYQNAAFAWGDVILDVNNSYFEGCGGPAVISMSVVKSEPHYHPTVTVNGTTTKTSLTGEEVWFVAVGADKLIGPIKALSTALKGANIGSFVDGNGNMNILGLLMAEGNGVESVGDLRAQGSILFDDKGITRFDGDPSWEAMKYITNQALSAGSTQLPPFLTVNNGESSYTIYTDGTNFYDLQGRALGTDASHQALMAAFMTADTITLTQGGLSVVFAFYH